MLILFYMTGIGNMKAVTSYMEDLATCGKKDWKEKRREGKTNKMAQMHLSLAVQLNNMLGRKQRNNA